MKGFERFGIDEVIVRALKDMGYKTPSEVQERTIPLILDGKNVAVKSYTGSGKTAAFGIPLIHNIISGRNRGLLILGPTRELVVQVRDELRRIGKNTGLKIIAVYGGHGIEGEAQLLNKGVDIICATPGRLLDHIRRGNIDLDYFDTVVLDEADRMLDMGFIEDIREILSNFKPQQVHLFSATLNRGVRSLISDFLTDPTEVFIKKEIVGTNITEKHEMVDRKSKFGRLLKYIREAGKGRVLIFVSTKRFANSLVERLSRKGIRAVAMHGDLSQKKREIALAAFKRGSAKVMVATDVAARGLQIDNVEYVLNSYPANDQNPHQHRIGLTGRMGKKSTAINLIETDGPVRKGLEHKSTREHIMRGY